LTCSNNASESIEYMELSSATEGLKQRYNLRLKWHWLFQEKQIYVTSCTVNPFMFFFYYLTCISCLWWC